MNTTTNDANRPDAERRNEILVGDVRTRLADIATDTVDCVITSPPYFRLRNYGTDDQIGLEDHVDSWVDEMRSIFNDLTRVLKPTGSVWLNVGDSYSRHPNTGAPAKSLLLAPERLLLALQADGWTVRNKVIWAKTNPMPNAVKDRLSCTHEYVYFLTRNRDYFFDLDTIRTPHTSKTTTVKTPPTVTYPPAAASAPEWAGPLAGNNAGLNAHKQAGRAGHPLGKNPGDVWHLATASYHGAHFATYPTKLIERPLLATCPERVCTTCGLPWDRQPHRTIGHLAVHGALRATCSCSAAHRPGVVLDPFFGAGTTALAAEQHRRHWIGIEINPEFADLARERITTARDRRRHKPEAQISRRSDDPQHSTKRAA